jgi:GDP-D-mannose dehydratase
VDTRANYVADALRAEKELGWKPPVDFNRLVHMMVDNELARLKGR